MQILEDRNNGGGGQVCPLYFDGAVSEFYELPLPDNKREVDKVLEYIEDNIRKKSNPIFLLLSKGNEIFRKKFYKLIY